MINRLFAYIIQCVMTLMQRTRFSRWVMQGWFGLSLYVQLMLGSGLLLIAVGSAAAFWNIAQQEKSLISVSEQQVMSLAKVMASASLSALEAQQFDTWRTVGKTALEEPTMSISIQI